MNKETNNVEIEDVIEEVEEETLKKGLLDKAKDGFNKHRKVIVSVGAVITGGLICYAIGHKIKGVDHEIAGDIVDNACTFVEDATEE